MAVSPLASDIAGISLRTPLIAAAGTCGYVQELADVLDVRHLGAIVTKSLTQQPREGNRPWRIIDLPRASGMLNAIGLANVGLDRFMSEYAPSIQTADTVIFGSIAGHSINEYVAVAEAFDGIERMPAVELNVSCPNTADGLQFGESAARLSELLREVRPVLKRSRMIVKLSPNVGDIVGTAKAAIDSGADALTLINTVSALALDVESREPRLSRGSGGLSGPAIHPIAVRMVSDVYRHVAKAARVPIIGLGGVLAWQDAAEFILAGASAVGIGTGLFVDPALPKRITRGLTQWVMRQGCASVTELIGQAKWS